jgi:hypothetical protein
MKNTITALVCTLIILTSCTNKQAGKESKTEPAKATLTELLQTPEKYTGKTIIIEGLVTHVCRHGGQKLFITETDNDQKMRITTGNNISEFDVALEGSEIVVEGIFRTQVINEAYISALEKEAQLHEEKSGEENTMAPEGGDGMENAANLRAQLEASGEDQITDYWVENVNYKIKDQKD